eukprot:468830-Amorphochlora_amoeboformis.AAC.4
MEARKRINEISSQLTKAAISPSSQGASKSRRVVGDEVAVVTGGGAGMFRKKEFGGIGLESLLVLCWMPIDICVCGVRIAFAWCCLRIAASVVLLAAEFCLASVCFGDAF